MTLSGNVVAYLSDRARMRHQGFCFSVVVLLLTWVAQGKSAFAQDQTPCTPVRFAHGATSIVISGNADPVLDACYTFRASVNQDAHILVKSQNVYISVTGVGGARKEMLFRTESKNYRLLIEKNRHDASADRYTVTLTITNAISRLGPLNGTWNYEYSCAGATGMYLDRCNAGMRDNFTLSIFHIGNRVCGSYSTAAQLGNHVDGGDLSDWTFTQTGNATYRAKYHLSGTVGEASVRVDGQKLYWKVLTEHQHDELEPSDWRFSPPNAATMVSEPFRSRWSERCAE